MRTSSMSPASTLLLLALAPALAPPHSAAASAVAGAELCAQLEDPARNGDRTRADLVDA